jgi:quercetin dioxygenase-like cupin family protein
MTSEVLDWTGSGFVASPDATVWSATADTVQLVRSQLRGGASFPEHSHPQEQVTVVLEGAVEITLAGSAYPLRPGQVLRVPADVPHSAKVVSEEPAMILEAFAPIRPDLNHDAL